MYRRSWRKVRRFLHPIRLRPLLAHLDQAKLHAIEERYRGSPEHYAKYADVRRWLKLNIRRAQDLQLHRLPPQSVLDLGCGGGFFLYILQHLGHSCLGLDIAVFPLFPELLDLFQVPRIIWKIRPFEPLPDLGRRFDLITAFSTSFNRLEQTAWWGPGEWRFFLDDLERHLNPRGRIFLGLNPDNRGNYYTSELREFFLSRRATIDRETVSFVPAHHRVDITDSD